MSWAEALPIWLVIAAFAGGVWYAWRWWTNPIRRNLDVCQDCGYDMRATPARCPECGRIDPTYARYAQLERLRNDWPDEDMPIRMPEPGESRVVAHEDDNRMQIDLLAEHMEARGIDCEVEDATLISRVRQTYGTHKLVVWDGDAERAEHVIDDLLGDAAVADAASGEGTAGNVG